MPHSAPYLAACGCIVKPGTRCVHQQRRSAQSKAAFDQKRPSAAARGYDSKWQIARRDYLVANPTCCVQGCGQKATVVDHIIAHKGDLKLFWRRSNWQPMCAHHHNSSKQRQEKCRG